MQRDEYNVKLEQFEGPLDLLLNLIEKRKLFINDIALSKVTDDYISHIRQCEEFPISDSAQFILIASTLLLIKSKSLLPTLELTGEEQTSIHELEDRLKLYQRMRDLSVHVKERFGKNIMFERNQSKEIQSVFSPDESMNISNLLSSLKDVLKNLPKKEIVPKAIVKKVISLEEMIGRLTDRIKVNLRMSFKEFAKSHTSSNSAEIKEHRVHVIVSFLAMLELVKQGVIMVTQEKEFDDIQIETHEVGVPHYS